VLGVHIGGGERGRGPLVCRGMVGARGRTVLGVHIVGGGRVGGGLLLGLANMWCHGGGLVVICGRVVVRGLEEGVGWVGVGVRGLEGVCIVVRVRVRVGGWEEVGCIIV